jgi:hypothetical protein
MNFVSLLHRLHAQRHCRVRHYPNTCYDLVLLGKSPTGPLLILIYACDSKGTLTLLVCAWAGEDVEKQASYGPFSLMLRLIIELSNGVLLPAPPQVARELDPQQFPFQTFNCVYEEFAVQRQAASNTKVSVRTHSCF